VGSKAGAIFRRFEAVGWVLVAGALRFGADDGNEGCCGAFAMIVGVKLTKGFCPGWNVIDIGAEDVPMVVCELY